MVRRPVTGEIRVAYGQIYVVSGSDDQPDLRETFAGQTEGLCGAAVPGFLWLVTGLDTGEVGFTVEVHDSAPDVDPEWEDVVEVSFRPRSADAALEEWGGGRVGLGLGETDYRVRYCARGMDLGRDLDTRSGDEPDADRYLLQFWPAPPEPDRVLLQTSQIAADWHGFARELPPPPTAAERAEEERRARAEQERIDRDRRVKEERYTWGGRLPGDALRAAEGVARGLLRFDADLVHALGAAGPALQRAVALLATRRAYEAAGIADLAWVVPALDALAEGRPLPPPFDDGEHMFRTLREDPAAPKRGIGAAVPPAKPPRPVSAWRSGAGCSVSVIRASGSSNSPQTGPGSRLVSQVHMALRAVVRASDPNPLKAAIGAVSAAVDAHGENWPAFLREVWALLTTEGGATPPTAPA